MTAEMDMHDKFIKINQNGKDSYIDQGSEKLGILYISCAFTELSQICITNMCYPYNLRKEQ